MKAVAAILTAVAAAAPPPVAKGPGLVASYGGRIYVNGKPLAAGTEPTWSRDGKRSPFSARVTSSSSTRTAATSAG